MPIPGRLFGRPGRDRRGFEEFPLALASALGATHRGSDRDARRLDGIRRASLDRLTQTARPTQRGFGPAFLCPPSDSQALKLSSSQTLKLSSSQIL